MGENFIDEDGKSLSPSNFKVSSYFNREKEILSLVGFKLYGNNTVVNKPPIIPQTFLSVTSVKQWETEDAEENTTEKSEQACQKPSRLIKANENIHHASLSSLQQLPTTNQSSSNAIITPELPNEGFQGTHVQTSMSLRNSQVQFNVEPRENQTVQASHSTRNRLPLPPLLPLFSEPTPDFGKPGTGPRRGRPPGRKNKNSSPAHGARKPVTKNSSMLPPHSHHVGLPTPMSFVTVPYIGNHPMLSTNNCVYGVILPQSRAEPSVQSSFLSNYSKATSDNFHVPKRPRGRPPGSKNGCRQQRAVKTPTVPEGTNTHQLYIHAPVEVWPIIQPPISSSFLSPHLVEIDRNKGNYQPQSSTNTNSVNKTPTRNITNDQRVYLPFYGQENPATTYNASLITHQDQSLVHNVSNSLNSASFCPRIGSFSSDRTFTSIDSANRFHHVAGTTTSHGSFEGLSSLSQAEVTDDDISSSVPTLQVQGFSASAIEEVDNAKSESHHPVPGSCHSHYLPILQTIDKKSQYDHEFTENVHISKTVDMLMSEDCHEKLKERYLNYPGVFEQLMTLISDFKRRCNFLQKYYSSDIQEFQQVLYAEKYKVYEEVFKFLSKQSGLRNFMFSQCPSYRNSAYSDISSASPITTNCNDEQSQQEIGQNETPFTSETLDQFNSNSDRKSVLSTASEETTTASDIVELDIQECIQNLNDNLDSNPISLISNSLDLVTHETLFSEELLEDQDPPSPILFTGELIDRMKTHHDLFNYISFNIKVSACEILEQIRTSVAKVINDDFVSFKWKEILATRLSLVLYEKHELHEYLERLLQITIELKCKKPPVLHTDESWVIVKKTSPITNQLGNPVESSNKSPKVSPIQFQRALNGGSNLKISSSKFSISDPSYSQNKDLERDNIDCGNTHRTKRKVFQLPLKSESLLTSNVVEDARYEMDMMFLQISQTIEMLEEIRKIIRKLETMDRKLYFELDDNFGGRTVLHKIFLQKLFTGERVVTGLHKFPFLFLPDVLEKLNEIRKLVHKVAGKWLAFVNKMVNTWNKEIERTGVNYEPSRKKNKL